MRHGLGRILGGLAVGLSAAVAWGAPPGKVVAAEELKFFESQVRPLLAENCFGCHGEKKQKGGLRLDSAAGVSKGGKNGAVVAPGKVAESKVIVAVSYGDKELQMPPEESGRLSAAQVEVLERWVEMGAPFPADDGGAEAVLPLKGSKKRVITDADRGFWSFQAPRAVEAPVARDPAWNANVVDRFVFAKLAAEGITPAPRADKVTLVRRAYLDLHGLPPTPAEVDAFVGDASADAWEKLVDRLLASPRYGERMARHWLDLVRYAESDGYKQDGYRPNAWPYRDYVIRSFNDDKPYDQFVAEQLAGDEIAPEDPEVVIGTAFFRHGVYEYNQRDVKRHWQVTLDEMTDVAADAFLGLSMGCAKCHDHKFDPILQTDYYRFQGFLAPLLPKQDAVLATTEARAKHEAAMGVWRERTAEIRARLEAIERPYAEKNFEGLIKKFHVDLQDILRKAPKDRTPYEEQIAALALRQVYDPAASGEVKVTGKEKPEHDALLAKLATFDGLKPKPLPTAMLVGDVGPVAPPSLVPGDLSMTDVGVGAPVVLPSADIKVRALENSTGRRTALAQWLTRPDHPLTGRVMVNRIWQYHFGRGLVGTASDFGRLGDRPTHPELLDTLAVRLVENGWRMKGIHRLILTSETYRQASAVEEHGPQAGRLNELPAKTKDPENRWLWKYPARRLDAEQIRDAMLSVSGELRFDAGGPGVDPSTPRRAIYTKALRNNRDPLLDAFDAPDTFGSTADRNRTTTATQSLLMINGDAVLKRAEMFAGRLREMKLKDAGETVDAAWRLAYGRSPTAGQRERAVGFLEKARVAKRESPKVAGGDLGARTIDEKPLVKAMPQLGSQAVYVRNARPEDVLRLAEPAGMPTEDFTVEAYVLLDSIYDDAKVRVIASRWDGANDHPGWSLGVTSAKSKHGPRNVILQLATAGGGYEVIPSDFRVELHRTYYVAVSVRLNDSSAAGVTFYLKDMSDMDAGLKSVGVRHSQTASYASAAALVLGGRDRGGMGWDGLIDEVRISSKALSKDELLFNDGRPAKGAVCAHWVFEDRPGLLKDSAGVQRELVKATAARAVKALSPADAALVDLCHVLLNSNGFLYLD